MKIVSLTGPVMTDAVVMVANLPDALFAPTAGWRRDHDQDLLNDFAEVLESIEDETGEIIEVSPELIVAIFDGDPLAASHAATNLQEWLSERGQPARIGIGTGLLRRYEMQSAANGSSHVLVTGPASSRARALGGWARPGVLLLDAAVVAELAVEYLGSNAGKRNKWSGVDYLGPVAEIPRSPGIPPIAYNELLWSGTSLQVDETRAAGADSQAKPIRRLRGTVARMPRRNEFGRIEPLDDLEIPHVFQASSVVDDGMMVRGSKVVFSPSSPGEQDELPVATAVVRIGARLTGRVTKVFASRHYAFVDVVDGDNTVHNLFMHADDNEWPVEIDDLVNFTVGENRQGPTVNDAVVVD